MLFRPVNSVSAIAVSGGVDSMALAFLCKQLEKKSAGQLSFRAIVVDHRARPGSHEEAEDVVKMLHGMGKQVYKSFPSEAGA